MEEVAGCSFQLLDGAMSGAGPDHVMLHAGGRLLRGVLALWPNPEGTTREPRCLVGARSVPVSSLAGATLSSATGPGRRFRSSVHLIERWNGTRLPEKFSPAAAGCGVDWLPLQRPA
jgi:hypothetical protein